MSSPSESPKKQLTLFDSTCLIVGIIVGSGIYALVPVIAAGAGSSSKFMALWLAGGAISLCGALGYAELAAAYPKEGGDYVYLTRAYGGWAGFLFGWLQLVVVRPGDIAGMAFAFALYAQAIFDPFPNVHLSYNWLPYANQNADPVHLSQILYALAAVAILTGINILGVPQGKWTQNLLTIVKTLGLLAIVGVAIAGPGGQPIDSAVHGPGLRVALILVLFTFGGWNEMAYVAAEVKNPAKNIVRALVLGTVAVTVLYFIVSGAFLYSLGFSGVANSQAVAADAISTVFHKYAAAIVSALICISALGAANGLIFTGARISYAVGADHPVFRLLGRWNSRTGTPIRSLLLQGTIAAGLIVLLGSFVNAVLYTAAAAYTFYLATSLAVVVLRSKEPEVQRPYRVSWYPLPTILFCLVCAVLIHSAVVYSPWAATGALSIFAVGLPVYWLSNAIAAKGRTRTELPRQ
jgi:basic amino acid/polyamine antiporter, APA family